MFLLVSILSLFTVATSGLEINIEKFQAELQQWETHISKYGLKFSETEYYERMSIYLSNQRIIEDMNKQELGYTLEMNRFGHMTNEEFVQYLKTSSSNPKSESRNVYTPKNHIIPKDIDYRSLGAVTRVKDQGACGSCWAFSAVGCLESQYLLKFKKNQTFSEQQLVDCSHEGGNEGCNGGLMDDAFSYIGKYGLMNDSIYKYQGEDGICEQNPNFSEVYVDEVFDIEEGNETALTLALIGHGPISVGIDASGYGFQFYKSGIYRNKHCSSTHINHGVLLVGIGSSPCKYYIVKNSWGTHWGMEGYFYLPRDMNNTCGIATMSSFATILAKKHQI